MSVPPRLTPDQAVFLDFDGTLVEIAPTPDTVVVPEGMREALSGAAACLDGALAIVSGRMLSDIDSRLAPLVLPGSGSHGVERRNFAGEVVAADPAIRQTAAAIAADLRERVGHLEGVLVEEKHWSPSLHFRGAPHLGELCIATMRDLAGRRPGWEVIEGKMVVEARLAGISKADAVKDFMREAPFNGRVPVFVGDDRTDEDGMRAAAALGGYGIKVGEGDSVAKYRLSGPAAVRGFLEDC